MATEAPRVAVLGSVHMDLIATARRLPAPGESVTGDRFAMAPGGKGGNQACQFALEGCRTAMIARLGDDLFGRRLRAALEEKGVATGAVVVDASAATGASTVLAAAGDYASIIVPGAAALLSEADVDAARTEIAEADALVLQLELPIGVATHAARIAKAAGTAVALNLAPMPDDWGAGHEALARLADMLIANRVEAGRLLGHPGTDAISAARALAAQFEVETVLITLGAEGAAAVAGGEAASVPAFPITVADTVGAGDAFLGAFVTARLRGAALADALRRGAAAGALAASRAGVHDALPTASEIDALLAR